MRSIMKLTTALSGVAMLGLFAGCAHNPPDELVDAREAYRQAQASRAPELAPAPLYTAAEALAVAERAFQEDADAQYTRDLAYIAERKSQLAIAQAGIELAQRAKSEADKEFYEAQAQLNVQTQQQLAMTREQLAEAERQRALEAIQSQHRQELATNELEATRQQAQQELARTSSELERERQARIEAEQRAQQAMTDLQKLGDVKEDARGTVITIPGSVLFASAQWSLLPPAVDRLSQVASALQDIIKYRTILIEGHTDSQGSDAYNMDLSQKRAESVRSFLIQRGIPSDKIRAVGMGEGRAVADNSSPEGRAMNRRVEIIVERERSAMR